MNKIIFFLSLLIQLSGTAVFAQGVAKGSFVAGKNEFLLNGKPFIIRAAELHYTRIPMAYWEHRIQMCKAMGMNTICIYLFWNYHEQEQGKFDFSGDKDFTAFIRLVQKNGMYCIVRPGPYVCAEWDMGGLPWWLLKKNDLQVRSIADSFFMDRVKIYLDKVGALLAPYQVQNGGNILMVQVENEYAVWGNDEKYMGTIRDYLKASGLDKIQLFRCDWASNFNKYKLDGVAATLNFGAGSNIEQQFKEFKTVYPEAPLMCSEYWTGWFDQWGRPHETRGVNTFMGSLKEMLDKRISFSLYMAHGGTSFGQWAGANAPPYAPTVSSYDYDAPINEAGQPTEKFFALRELLNNYLQEGEVLGDIPPAPSAMINVPPIKFKSSAALFSNLPVVIRSKEIKTMEQLNQGWGRILYRAFIPPSTKKRKIYITDVHDWALVYLDGKQVKTIDRRRGNDTIQIPALKNNTRLDILVEAGGRVNYGKAIIDRKGITDAVELIEAGNKRKIEDWSLYNFPVGHEFQLDKNYRPGNSKGPSWFQAEFLIDSIGDSFLDVSQWGKGMVWVNGHNLGRFWKTGPTQSMFLPGCWLKKGSNKIIVFDLDPPLVTQIEGKTAPIYRISVDSSLLHRKSGQNLKLESADIKMQGSIGNSGGWQEMLLPKISRGRYFCFEALSGQDPKDPLASVAEFEIILENGTTASSLNWKVLYADSEELVRSNSTADKLFDLQETLIWQTSGAGGGYPHSVVIDLGSVIKIKGFRILMRRDKSKAGLVKDFRFHLRSTPFKY